MKEPGNLHWLFWDFAVCFGFGFLSCVQVCVFPVVEGFCLLVWVRFSFCLVLWRFFCCSFYCVMVGLSNLPPKPVCLETSFYLLIQSSPTLNPSKDIFVSLQIARLRFSEWRDLFSLYWDSPEATRNPQRAPGTGQPTLPCSELQHAPCWQGWQLCCASAAPEILIIGTAITHINTPKAAHQGLQILPGPHWILNHLLALAQDLT